MKRVFYCVCTLWLCFAGCRENRQEAFYGAGVSEELARWRKAVIQDLEYDLFFSLPAARNEAVEGEVTVTFSLEKAQEIIFDWRFDWAESCSVEEVNGERPVAVFYQGEHIIVPAENWEAGGNKVRLRFTSDNQSLNRNEEFLYTLLVPDRARTLFPCFDQPDLKARFTLSLEVPEDWQAVSNTYVLEEKLAAEGRRVVHFAPTEPLSTYLFSFVAGKLARREFREDGRNICAYYRETDPKKVAQLDTIFKQVAHSLRWLEEFTGMPYPFAKYDFIILPGFQYGGMEHTGATLYNDNRMFLGEHPTPDEELGRAQLIAHETAHMWFGDYVTMAWFDDVWTKEVFANYFAACISEPMFPAMNHALTWLRGYTAASLAEDRTAGTTAIKQPLENLSNAGLIYGKIIYNKAPVMMKKLVNLMGEEAFREGIREYVRTFGFGNATWEDLVAILDSRSEVDLQAFSRVWVHEKGMPHISFAQENGYLEIRQSDPYGRGLVWHQSFGVRLYGERDTTVEVRIADTLTRVALPFEVTHVVPNADGRGYGLLMPDSRSMSWLLRHWQEIPDETARQAAVMLLYENYLAKRVDDKEWITAVFNGLAVEKNALIASTLATYAAVPLRALGEERDYWEEKLWLLAQTHAIPSCRTQLLRVLIANHVSEGVGDKMYALWKRRNNKWLNDNDYTTLAYELSIRYPERQQEILGTQRARISDPDRLRQFDFIARAVVADTVALDTLFHSFLQAENRRMEPWTATALRYLNHALRDEYAVKYIYPALEALQEVQRTGDIFFPADWASALLSQHRSEAAYREVKRFLDERPGYPVLLKNKILQAADPLYRKYDAV